MSIFLYYILKSKLFYVCTHIHTHVHTHTHIYIYVCVHVHVCYINSIFINIIVFVDTAAKIIMEYFSLSTLFRECSINFDSQKLSYSTDINKKVARQKAATIALEKLQKHCYTVKVKKN